MAVLMTQDLQGANREVVEAVSDDLGVFDNPPAGLIAHVLTETDGGIRAVDIWESEALSGLRQRATDAERAENPSGAWYVHGWVF